ncbi:MAG: hypothetical protein ACOX9R_15450 [Armatimonadota bacterium]
MVTRLDDPIPPEPGTLRWALEKVDGPHIIVFRVGGVIELSQPIWSWKSNITIAGQTAPGDGICVKGKVDIGGSNVIVRYMRFRQGEVGQGDGIELWGTNYMIDHCSFSWASDENVGFHQLDGPRNTTVQWSILSEGEKGSMASMGDMYNVTFHHNLFAHNYIRNPLVGGDSAGDGRVYDLRNNVVYDLGNSGFEMRGYADVNVVGNYFKVGDTSRLHRYCLNLRSGDPPRPGIHIYLADHWGPRVAGGRPMWDEVQYHDTWGNADEEMHRVYQPFPAPPVTTHDPHTAYELVLGNAGATLPRRDPVDERVVSDVATGGNSGGFRFYMDRSRVAQQWSTLTYANGTPPDDTDGDGMPDSWEIARGLNPQDPTDATGYDLDPNYTNIEVYINSLVPSSPAGNLQPTANAGPDQTIDTNDPTGADVALDGSASFDPDGDALTYQWTWQDADGNQQSATGVNPTVRLPVGQTVVTLVVSDGALTSVPDTTTITINTDNRPPNQPDVGITPEHPDTTDALTATATGTDPDGDTVGYSYAWYRDDVLQEQLTSKTVSADLTSRGQVWHVIVTPSDGHLEGDPGQASVTIGNAPPTKPTVAISPTSPKSTDDLLASAQGSTDPDGDDVTYEFAWYRDAGDQPPSPIVTGNTVSSDLTASGETWRVVAIPSDGQSTGEPAEAAVTIDGAAPSQPTVSISPTSPVTTDPLIATAEGSVDPDGGTVNYSYAWYKDGALQTDLTGTTVPADRTVKGQIWRVVVTPDDGTNAGPSGEASVTVRNSAPSAPSISLSPTSPRTSDTLVTGAAGSTDPDGDDVTYEYTWYRDGAVQTSLKGATVSSERTAKGQTWRVVVIATDGSADSTGADASVTIINSAPTQPTVSITPDAPSTGDDLTAGVEGSTDADGDTISFDYAWYRNGTLQEGLSGPTVSADLTDGGDSWRVVVTPTDGEATGDPGEATATVDNSAPTRPTVSLSPQSPATDQDIVATAEGSVDPDGDAVTYRYSWQRNGVVQSGITGPTVSADLTSRDDTWQVTVTTTDGQSTSPGATASVTVVNTPPTRPAVTIVPEIPLPTDQLVAQAADSTDLDGDAVTYRYAWYRDDALQADLTTSTVPAGRTSAGETWRAVVTPSDGTADGPTAEAGVTIQQSHSVSGTVLDRDGAPVAGVEVSDGVQTVLTDAQGQYTLAGYLAGASITVTALLPDHLTTPSSVRVKVPPDVTNADFRVHRVFTRTVSSGVQLLGTPVDPITSSPSQVWQSDLVARWDPARKAYVFFTDAIGRALSIGPGRGYFIRSSGGELSVAGAPVPTDAPFGLELAPGWNMVANMFLERLPFANIAANLPDHVQPAGYAYDPAVGYIIVASVSGVNVNRDYVEPWEGIWLHNSGGATTISVTPPGQTPASAAVAAAADDGVEGLIVPQSAVRSGRGWLIPIHVESPGASDRTTLVGVSTALSTPIEILDPPGAPESVSAHIIGPGGVPLAQNVRTGTEPASWDFVVSTDLPGAEISVRLPDLSSVPDDMVVYLTDVAAEKRIYARTMSRYSYTAADDGGQRRFRIEVLPRREAGLAITSMSASQGERAAGITFNVTAACQVTARVMNIAGRTVRTLTSNESVAEGTNTVSWNLRSERGTLVANGVYVIVLEARSPDGQQTRAISTMSVRR